MAIYLIRRTTKDGSPRFIVRYRETRVSPITHLGSFKTRKEALARKGWAEMELAAGRIPDRKRITRRAQPRLTLRGVVDDFLAARVDVQAASLRAYRERLDHALEWFGEHADVASLDRGDVQAFVLGMEAAPRSVKSRVSTLSQALDHAGVEPNPAADRRLRFPRVEDDAKLLPSSREIAVILDEVPEHHRGVILLMEHTGVRVSEACALRHDDVDHARGRFLVRKSKTHAGTNRWIDYTPSWCAWQPPETGAGRVYPRSTPASVYKALERACERAGLPGYSNHSFRHLHASRCLHHAWLSPAEIAARLGHASPKLTLGLYSHVVPPE